MLPGKGVHRSMLCAVRKVPRWGAASRMYFVLSEHNKAVCDELPAALVCLDRMNTPEQACLGIGERWEQTPQCVSWEL